MEHFRLATAVVAIALVAGACGGDGTATGDGSPSPTPAIEVDNVEMTDSLRFEPERITVPAGTTVTWRNTGQLSHTVTAREGANFDSGTVGGGGTYKHTFQEAGTVTYTCILHADMDGSVTVTEA